MYKWHLKYNHSFMRCPVCKKVIETKNSVLEKGPHFYCSKECMETTRDKCPKCLQAPKDPEKWYCAACRAAFGKLTEERAKLRNMYR